MQTGPNVIDLRRFKVGAYVGGFSGKTGLCPHCGEVGAIIKKTAKSPTGYWAHEVIGETATSEADARPCPASLKGMPNGTTRPKTVKLPKRKKEQLTMWDK